MRFEEEVGKIKREGVDKLMNYVRKSDFYTAPSSTAFHLSVAGGLLQHSINVMKALRDILTDNGDGTYSYMLLGSEVAKISEETLVLISLFHDICKTKFYTVEKRNKKIDGSWVEVDTFAIDDEIPYGHGEKSVMMLEAFMKLSLDEKMAIRWHMGFPEDFQGRNTFSQAVDKYPIIWALHTADLMASKFMEDKEDNRPGFGVAAGR